MSEDTGASGRAGPSQPVNIPLTVASVVVRQAATGAARAARSILRRIDGR